MRLTLKELRSQIQEKLRKFFQFYISDLDFGNHQIFNDKRDKVLQFIENDLSYFDGLFLMVIES